MSLLTPPLNPNITTLKLTSLLLLLPPHTFLSHNHKLSLPKSLKSPTNLHCQSSSSFNSPYLVQNDDVEFEFEDIDSAVGDCVVFEEGIFEDPYLQNNNYNDRKASNPKKPQKRKQHKRNSVEIEPENLVPDEWRQYQEEINMTKKEKRKIAQQIEFGSRVEKKKQGYVPLRNIDLKEYLVYKQEKLAQLNPVYLHKPLKFPDVKESKEIDVNENVNSSERVAPKNPRWAVYGRGLDDVSEFFNSQYEPPDKKSEGPRKLFSKEEKVLLNKKIPDLATATSKKWLPLHTLAASGEFYLVDTLLKHNVDINAVDKNGLTALHKAIIGKKQAVTNYLLRESANPFVRDEEGATLLHYAVQTASSTAIKILLLYNVDINLQDNDGWTPLHLAVQAQRTDVVRLLLIKGADKTLKNQDGLTPLDLCLYSGQDIRTYELIRLLKLLPKPR